MNFGANPVYTQECKIKDLTRSLFLTLARFVQMPHLSFSRRVTMGGIEDSGERLMLSRLFHFLVLLASYVGLLLIAVTTVPLLHYWTTALSTPWGDENGDILIVLGGDTIAPDMIGITSYWRSCYTVRAWRTGHYHSIVLSGKDVAPLMRDCMTSQGVPPEVILLETTSQSTRENALYVSALLRGDTTRKVLLTSDFHMGRALSAFRKAGIEASPLPIPDAHKRLGDWTQRWGIFWILLQETAKVVYYKAHGWT